MKKTKTVLCTKKSCYIGSFRNRVWVVSGSCCAHATEKNQNKENSLKPYIKWAAQRHFLKFDFSQMYWNSMRTTISKNIALKEHTKYPFDSTIISIRRLNTLNWLFWHF